MIEKNCIKIMNEIISMIKIQDVIKIEIKIEFEFEILAQPKPKSTQKKQTVLFLI